jgi:hypothetical protein
MFCCMRCGLLSAWMRCLVQGRLRDKKKQHNYAARRCSDLYLQRSQDLAGSGVPSGRSQKFFLEKAATFRGAKTVSRKGFRDPRTFLWQLEQPWSARTPAPKLQGRVGRFRTFETRPVPAVARQDCPVCQLPMISYTCAGIHHQRRALVSL